MATEAFVYTINQVGRMGAWSRYLFPFDIDYYATVGNDLFVREGDRVLRLDPVATLDSVYDPEAEDDIGAPITSVLQWPWLDFGQIGRQKMMAGFDIQGDGTVSVQFGYDERNPAALTESWSIFPETDSVPGMILPFPLTAPSISVKLTYASTDSWRWDGFTVYLQDQRLTS